MCRNFKQPSYEPKRVLHSFRRSSLHSTLYEEISLAAMATDYERPLRKDVRVIYLIKGAGLLSTSIIQNVLFRCARRNVWQRRQISVKWNDDTWIQIGTAISPSHCCVMGPPFVLGANSSCGLSCLLEGKFSLLLLTGKPQFSDPFFSYHLNFHRSIQLKKCVDQMTLGSSFVGRDFIPPIFFPSSKPESLSLSIGCISAPFD